MFDDPELYDYRKAFMQYRPSWYDLGLCGQTRFKLFTKDGVTTIWFGNAKEQRQAEVICKMCPIRWACLEHNLDVEYGVYGGLNQKRREKLIRELVIRDRAVIKSIVELEEANARLGY